MGLGVDDEPAVIAENRTRAVAAVAPGTRLVTVCQVHSPDCVTVDAPWSEQERPHADALVTARSGLVLGVVTADCAPVLFADPGAGVVGAAHAGWRGALAGVTDATIAAMEALGANRANIAAAVGPCIAKESYEVDEGFRIRFLAAAGGNARFFDEVRAGHCQFDLPGYVVARLRDAGIGRVESLDLDTYTNSSQFYSFRRATHRGEPACGRQISLIALPSG